MCGITGYINLSNKPIRDTNTVLQMLKVQKHRGPDDSGIWAFSFKTGKSIELPVAESVSIPDSFNAILGFNRLSILDLSANGHQPMASTDQKVLLTLNGEIYNAFDYKKELIDWGYHFKSTTDTEIVLALYLKYGFDGMLQRLNGMFAIVLADLQKGELYIARDRFGIKPIYYIANEELLTFSSELKSFRFLEDFRFNLNFEQLDEYLLFRNNIQDTLFEDIHLLSPGHYLIYSKDKVIKIKQFFDVNNFVRDNGKNGNINDYQQKFERWLAKSVESQLMSDVKLGCQLSGGIDSSLVTWFANKTAGKGLFESVSIVFNEKRFTEEPYINKVVDQLGIQSHKFLLDSAYYLDNIAKATWHFESPINHPNTIGIFLLAQRAKEFVTVLLSGEGADEVFGGYSRYYEIRYPWLNKRFLSIIKNSFSQPKVLREYFSPRNRSIMSTAYMPPNIAQKLVPKFNDKKALNNRHVLYDNMVGSSFDKQVKYEILTYLPDLLIRQDKMSMAHSIENRVPFLDNDVVENSFQIPEKFLVLRNSPEGRNTEKYLLKKTAASIFSQDFAFRDKMGFGIPLMQFFSNPEFLNYLHDQVLPGIKNRNIMNYKVVKDWLHNLLSLSYYEIESLWIAVSFEIWASTYLDLNNENWNTKY